MGTSSRGEFGVEGLIKNTWGKKSDSHESSTEAIFQEVFVEFH